ncbi:MAG: Asp-tRNA(Asn)/Glu-tRNA(Gln) amidotransferase subunit GatA [candidate division FCPU426 bacterium]
MGLQSLTIFDAVKGLREKKFSAVELCRALLERIEAVEPRVHAYMTVDREGALVAAAAADKAYAEGSAGRLCGVPLAIKDNLSTKGLRTTCSSKMLEDYVPPFDATVVARLKAEGSVLLGKTNLDEFAMGSSTENSAFGPTKNPWDLGTVPGGSSGGSAAAVAADLCLGSLGSDTGGSIRQPAALCGVVGLKPTYGRVSRYGLVAFASSLDQVGPITKTVRDAALLSAVLDGYDPMDSTCVDQAVPDYQAALGQGVQGLRIGLPKEYFAEGLEPEVRVAVMAAVTRLEKLGATIVPLSLPNTAHCLSVYYLLAPAEASSNLARYDGVRYGFRAEGVSSLVPMYMKTRAQGFGPEVKRRIMLGTHALSSGYYDAYYLKAQKVRTLIKGDFDRAWEQGVDLIATPTAPAPAFAFGAKTADPLTMYLSDIFTLSANLAGVPAISVPCGYSSKGLPIGLQLLGRAFGEVDLFRAAHAYETSEAWGQKKPVL